LYNEVGSTYSDGYVICCRGPTSRVHYSRARLAKNANRPGNSVTGGPKFSSTAHETTIVDDNNLRRKTVLIVRTVRVRLKILREPLTPGPCRLRASPRFVFRSARNGRIITTTGVIPIRSRRFCFTRRQITSPARPTGPFSHYSSSVGRPYISYGR